MNHPCVNIHKTSLLFNNDYEEVKISRIILYLLYYDNHMVQLLTNGKNKERWSPDS